MYALAFGNTELDQFRQEKVIQKSLDLISLFHFYKLSNTILATTQKVHHLPQVGDN